MKKTLLNKGESLKCPCCGTDMEEVVEDFCLDWKPPGSESIGSPESCYNCEKWFAVEKLSETAYEVRKVLNSASP